MKMQHTRDSLVKRYYSLGKTGRSEWSALITDIERYIPECGPDKELEYLLLALKAHKIDHYKNKFNECCDMLLPVFEGLQDVKSLNFLGITILAQAVNYNADYNKSITLAHEIIDILKKVHSHEKGHFGVVFMVAFNMTLRLLRAKYSTTTGKHKEINAGFSYFLGIALDMSVKYDLPVIKAMLMVRDGAYNANYDQIHENLAWLNKAPGESKTYKPMLGEIGEYVRHLEDDKLSNALINCLIGFNARKQRELLNLTQEEVADALETERAVVHQIERGETGTSYERLAKLRNILHVDYNYLFGLSDIESEEDMLVHTTQQMLKGMPVEHILIVQDCIKAISQISTKGTEK